MAAEILRYFAYGSNMFEARLRQRVASATLMFSACLPRHELRFDKVSNKDGSGKCHVVEVEESRNVHGAVFQIAAEDEGKLDAAEGFGYGYDKKEVVVLCPQGNQISAFTYVATNIDPDLKPFSWYMRHVLEGAKALKLPGAHIKRLAAVEVIVDPDTDREKRELSIYPD